MSLAVVLITIVVFLCLVLIEVPVGFSLGISGTIGILLTDGASIVTAVLGALPFTSSASYTLFAVPMFILLGALVANAGISGRIFGAAGAILGRLPGGVAATTVIATAIFSGISGSSAADVATMGKISVSEMRKQGYAPAFAAAIVGAAGAFAALIPPSIALVIYGIIAEESIGALLLAGIIPGAFSAIALTGWIVVRESLRARDSAARPEIARALAVEESEGEGVGDPNPSRVPQPAQLLTVGEKLSGVAYAGALFLIVAGGIYAGVFTATEAAAVGAFASLVLSIPLWGSMAKARSVMATSLRETAEITSMIFLLLLGGSIFTYFVVTTNIPVRITEWIVGLSIPPSLVVAMFLLAIIPLGMFLDGLSIMLLTVPIVAPVVTSLGFDGVWFGVLVIKMIEIGLITPPVGINVYIMAGISDDLEVEQIFRAVTPFVFLDLAVSAVLFAIPPIITWLPSAAGF